MTNLLDREGAADGVGLADRILNFLLSVLLVELGLLLCVQVRD